IAIAIDSLAHFVTRRCPGYGENSLLDLGFSACEDSAVAVPDFPGHLPSNQVIVKPAENCFRWPSDKPFAGCVDQQATPLGIFGADCDRGILDDRAQGCKSVSLLHFF